MFDSLGDRMKRYEAPFSLQLPPRMPVVIRVDGRAFHRWTRGLERPFSGPFGTAMDQVALALCEEIQGACLAYVQSDEISVLVHGYRTFESQSWFGNDLQKMVSVAASLAASVLTWQSAWVFGGQTKLCSFDARAFVLPEADVTNYFLWRQNDAARNSVQMLARSLASHSECHGLGQKELAELCFQRGSKWEELPTRWRRGRCAVRGTYQAKAAGGEVTRHLWVIDNEIPIWKGPGREYIECHLATEQVEAAQ